MCGGGSSSAPNSVSEFKPPDYTVGGYQDYLAQAKANSAQPYTPFQGQRVAGFNETQQQAAQGFQDRMMNGDPTLNSARGLALDTTNGKYLENNPYINKVIGNNANNMAQGFEQGTAATNAAMANMQGAFGGSSYAMKQNMDAQGLAKQIGQMADQSRSQNYQYERGMQGQAMGMAPQFASVDQTDLKNGMAAGDVYRNYEQQGLDQAYNDYQDQSGYNQRMNEQFGNALSRTAGQGTTTTSGPGGSNLANILGGLGLGASAYSAFFK